MIQGINGVERDIPVLAMGRRPLIGTALLRDYHLGKIGRAHV